MRSFRLLVAAGVAPLLAGCGMLGPASAPPAAEPAAPTSASAAPTPAPTRPAVRAPRVPAGVTAGYVLYDRQTRRVVLRGNERRTMRSASVVKVLIALDYFAARPASAPVPAADAAMLRPMLRSSDDRAATLLWRRGGQGAIIGRMRARIGLTDTAPPPADKPGFWGYTAISALDIARTYRYLLERAPRPARTFIMTQLHQATQCGVDRFDQYFGVPRALPRPWAVKQGWSGFGDVPAVPCTGPRAPGVSPAAGGGPAFHPVAAPDLGLGRPVLHTTGTFGQGDRYVLVLLTLQPAGSPFQAAATRVTGLARQIGRAAG
ncbi:hypothetical protein DPM19_03970 [Actinomadura craniellae]|uniref:Serine hydrolase n=1 Tax=Actinomadura craniellae TaxID=2231787 RepID=A0A365HAH3_9ACTN|nr:hypothetical protein [Actinomadura craniellae]RAY16097.1 hypothetical protein DPM19_03970 [Actinomadura craniellae]